MIVFPCLWLISPSWLRWRLSRPALLMVLSIVPTVREHPPASTKWQPCTATGHQSGSLLHKPVDLGRFPARGGCRFWLIVIARITATCADHRIQLYGR